MIRRRELRAFVERRHLLTRRQDPLVPSDERLRLEQDVIVPLAAARKMYVYESKGFWRQIKSAA